MEWVLFAGGSTGRSTSTTVPSLIGTSWRGLKTPFSYLAGIVMSATSSILRANPCFPVDACYGGETAARLPLLLARPGGSLGNREVGGIGAGGGQDLLDAGDDVRVEGGDVVLLRKVVLQVVELDRQFRAQADALPVPGADGLLEAALVELPVEVV